MSWSMRAEGRRLTSPSRIRAIGPHEHHRCDGAMMVAYAMHLLRTDDAGQVHIHLDGEHGINAASISETTPE
jgi:hypothetical protein